MSESTGAPAQSAGGGAWGKASGGSFGRTVLVWAVGALVAYGVLAGIVISWQPGRFTQIALVVIATALTVILPKAVPRKVLYTAIVLVAFAAIFYLPSYVLSRVIEFQIRGTTRDADTTSYLVLTDHRARSADAPGETFRNDDAPLFWKVNSSDWEGLIQTMVGRRVRARVIGIRIADRSQYRNLIWVEEIESAPSAAPAAAPNPAPAAAPSAAPAAAPPAPSGPPAAPPGTNP